MAESPIRRAFCTPAGGIARVGLAMRRHRSTVLALQWATVALYAIAVVWPAWLPLPGEADGIRNHLTRFAQFMFWGVWWPFVILSVMLLGRTWCGLFCPEGALSEWAARWSLNRPIPRWMGWAGWPTVAFVATTVFGQMVSVYEYPKPALLILGGSTVAAVAVGLLYGRNKRVWCRHLCPVSGVFGLLARVAPVHFAVDRAAWDNATCARPPVNCAPLIDIRRMQSASACHMCGRCAGQRGAVKLSVRSPAAEILGPHAARADDAWPARLLVFGMLGVALGAFQWSASPWFIAAKQAAAEWLMAQEAWWALDAPGHWWLLTHYPALNDSFTWLDGGLLLAYIAATALVSGGWAWLALALGGRAANLPWTRLAMALIPFAGASVFVGLSLLTTGQLAGEGIALAWANPARMALLTLAALGSAALAWRLGRTPGALAAAFACGLPWWAWHRQFFVW